MTLIIDNSLARKVVAPELDFDEAAFSTETFEPQVVELDLDLPAKRRRKAKPADEARDAMPLGTWNWYKAPKPTLAGHIVGFAWSKEKNPAGFYVSFTVIWKGDKAWRGFAQRSNYHGWKTKRAAKEYCLDRLRDARKPKRERRYTIKPPA